MIFGGIDLTPYLLVTKVTRPIVPKVRLDETEVPGMDGTHVRATGLEPVEIAVDCNIVGGSLDEVAEARAVLASALSGGEKALVLDDAPERYMLARYRGGGGAGAQRAHAESHARVLLCRPRRLRAAALRAGVGIPARRRRRGNYRAYPTVTCRPPAGSSWTITNVSTGRFVRVEASFTGAQTVVLDMRAERCTVNGADWPVTVASDFFSLDGVQQIKTSGGTATLEWEERWL